MRLAQGEFICIYYRQFFFIYLIILFIHMQYFFLLLYNFFSMDRINFY